MKLRAQAPRMFVPAFFHAEHGGLQNHVEAQVSAARDAGYPVVLMCKPGPFADHMRSMCQVLPTDFSDLDRDAAAGLDAGPYDLVHAHPFAARKVGMRVAQEAGVPFAVTHHGPYLDDLDQHHDQVDLVVCISEAARRWIVWKSGIHPSRTVVVPNGVDTRIFHPRRGTRVPNRVVIPSRFDGDKRFLVDRVDEAWSHAADEINAWRHVDWLVVGDGTELPRLRRSADSVNEAAGRESIRFLGWQHPSG